MRSAALISFILALLASTAPSFARGGAPSVMDSPGYQRRLQESRQQLQAPPALAQPVVHHRKKRKPHH